MKTYTMQGQTVAQITLPRPSDDDPHPSLLLGGPDGDRIPTGYCFTAWLPDGWQDIRLEVRWETEGAGCWYVPGHPGLCPVGLFVKV